MSNLLNVKIKCCKCNTLIDVNERKDFIYKRECTDESGKQLWITYIDCPTCKHRHYVQIDDVETNKYKNECTSVMTAILRKGVSGKGVPQSQRTKYKKLDKKLNDLRLALIKSYVGKRLKDKQDGYMFVIDEFTVC